MKEYKKRKYFKTKIDLDSYKEAALKTAFYPNFGNNILYPTVAIIEECGELIEKIEEKASHLAIVKELGDVLWYCAMVFHEIKKPFVFDLEKSFMTPSMLYQAGSKLSGVIKKTERDHNGVFTKEKERELTEHINFILSFVYNVTTSIDYTIEEICKINIDKINERVKNGTIQGSGDNR